METGNNNISLSSLNKKDNVTNKGKSRMDILPITMKYDDQFLSYMLKAVWIKTLKIYA